MSALGHEATEHTAHSRFIFRPEVPDDPPEESMQVWKTFGIQKLKNCTIVPYIPTTQVDFSFTHTALPDNDQRVDRDVQAITMGSQFTSSSQFTVHTVQPPAAMSPVYMYSSMCRVTEYSSRSYKLVCQGVLVCIYSYSTLY